MKAAAFHHSQFSNIDKVSAKAIEPRELTTGQLGQDVRPDVENKQKTGKIAAGSRPVGG